VPEGYKAGTVLTFSLTVKYSQGNVSEVNEVQVAITNTAPIANAGNDKTVFQGSALTLSGINSHDINKDQLTYQWSVLSLPDNSIATISNENLINVNLIPDVVGAYSIQLEVKDGLNSDTDIIVLTVVQPSAGEMIFDPPEMVRIPDGNFLMGDESATAGTSQ